MSDKAIAISSYKTLVTTLKQEIQETGEKLNIIIEEQRVGLYWRMGRHIQTHLLEHKERAQYGKELISRLSAEININKSLLHRIIKFYNSFPKVVTSPLLTWSHYSGLLPVKDQKKREEYVDKIKKESLTVRDLRELITGEQSEQDAIADNTQENKKLSGIRGVPFVYKIKKIDFLKPNTSRQILDCGFNTFTDVDITNLLDFEPDQTVSVKKAGGRYTLQKSDTPVNQIYTYKAVVEKIIDGDTLWVVLDLGFKIFSRQKLRLYKLDAPPLETEEGVKAMNFIHGKLKPLDFIAVKTHWRDKYDRYLADIYYMPNEEDFLVVNNKGKYLNQELAGKGYCRIVSSL